MDSVNDFRRREGRRLGEERREITQRIHEAAGAHSGLYPAVVSRIGSLWLFHVELRADIDAALAVTRHRREQGTVANPGAYLLTRVRNACARHGIAWSSGSAQRRQA